MKHSTSKKTWIGILLLIFAVTQAMGQTVIDWETTAPKDISTILLELNESIDLSRTRVTTADPDDGLAAALEEMSRKANNFRKVILDIYRRGFIEPQRACTEIVNVLRRVALTAHQVRQFEYAIEVHKQLDKYVQGTFLEVEILIERAELQRKSDHDIGNDFGIANTYDSILGHSLFLQGNNFYNERHLDIFLEQAWYNELKDNKEGAASAYLAYLENKIALTPYRSGDAMDDQILGVLRSWSQSQAIMGFESAIRQISQSIVREESLPHEDPDLFNTDPTEPELGANFAFLWQRGGPF